jgi:integrase
MEWGNTRDGVTFHTLRHTMASLAANNGVDGDIIRELGGWRSHVMVDRYRRFANERVREAAAQLANIGSRRSQTRTRKDQRKTSSADRAANY